MNYYMIDLTKTYREKERSVFCWDFSSVIVKDHAVYVALIWWDVS